MIFLTGDLGFMALEPLQAAMGHRFINAGVSEQNMISVSAALAAQGFQVWAYSIAPFIYARPFEQIRNDITFHKLPVKLIGNGGGYGYGIQGPSHHAIEDYGVLQTLDNFRTLVPVFNEDIAACVERAATSSDAVYLRLGRGEQPAGYKVPEYAPFRQLTAGNGPVIISVGPITGSYIAAFEALNSARRPNLWAAAELPIDWESVPEALVAQLTQIRRLVIAEEHVKHGSFASVFTLGLAEKHIYLEDFRHVCARQHVYERYGSQLYLREQSGLDVANLVSISTASDVTSYV